MPAAREPRHPLEKRDLLHAEKPRTDRIDAVARKLMDEHRVAEAVDYIEISRTEDLIADLEREALQRGSPFLLSQVVRLRGRPADPARWRQVAETSKRDERWMDAVRALRLGGFEEEAESVRAEHCPDFEPFKPQNK